MLSHMPAKVCAVIGLLSFATAAHAAVECPQSVQGHRLTAFSLFEGDPRSRSSWRPAACRPERQLREHLAAAVVGRPCSGLPI